MRFDEFAYMRWAKTEGRRGRYRLTNSGMPEWTAAELGLAPEVLEMEPDDYDRPTRVTAAIARRYAVPAECVFVTASASHAAALVFLALLEPGDDVLLEEPGYPALLHLARLAGAAPRALPRRHEDGYALDPGALARLLRPATRLVGVTNLHNPSGVLAPAATLAECAAAAAKVGATLFVDEAYLDLCPDARTAFVPGANVVTIASVTKAYGLGGLRLGWVIANPELVARLMRLNDLLVVHPPFPSASIAARALADPAPFRRRIDAVGEVNRPQIEAFVRGRDDLDAVLPAHGIVVFPRLRGVADASAFAAKLLAEHDVNATPGHFFGGRAHLRLGFGRLPPDELEQALRRLGECLEKA